MASVVQVEESSYRHRLYSILKAYNVVLMSGGVSKGKFDDLPQVLTELGVVQKFHRIRQKPGKPFWFGQTEEQILLISIYIACGSIKKVIPESGTI